MTFADEANVRDTDIASLLKDAFRMKGTITGKARLDAKISGTLGEPLKYSGNGLLQTGQGMVSGFKAIDLIASIHGTKGLQFESSYVPFDLETGKIILLDGTLVKGVKLISGVWQ